MPGQALKNPDYKATLLDLALVLVTMFAVKSVFLEFEATWKYAGPISLLTALVVATWRLRVNAESWAMLGLRKPDSILKTAGLSVAAFLAIVLTGLGGGFVSDLVFEPLARESDRFADIKGNLPVLLMWVALAWISAGFAEEMLYRAFMITRLQKLFANMRFGTAFAVVVPALIFGYRHYYYQGANGALTVAFIGLMLGVFYVTLARNNLWPLIVAHGSVDTLGFASRYVECGTGGPDHWLC